MGKVVPVKKNIEQGIICIPIKDVLDNEPVFELGEQRGFTKITVMSAIIGVADGLLDNDIDYTSCYEFVNKVLPSVPGYNDLMDMVIHCALRLVKILPAKACELLYLKTGHRNLYLKVNLEP